MSILRYFNKHHGWHDGKRTPFSGGGGIVSAITDPISSVLGTDGSGGGILGAAASLDKAVGNTIPGGWATVGGAALLAAGITDPSLLSLADSGSLTPTALADAGVPQATIDSIGAQGAAAGSAATGGVAVDAAGLPITADTGVAGGTGLTGGAGATGLTSGGTVGSLATPTAGAIDASAGLAPASGSALAVSYTHLTLPTKRIV